MTKKVYDLKNRHRNKIVSFRMSEVENEQLNKFVNATGFTKQDYIINRVLKRDIIVNGNPRVFKALKNQLNEVVIELKRIETFDSENDELLELISFITKILGGLSIEKQQ